MYKSLMSSFTLDFIETKKDKFLWLKQFGKSIIEYETELRELA